MHLKNNSDRILAILTISKFCVKKTKQVSNKYEYQQKFDKKTILNWKMSTETYLICYN